LVFEAHLAGQPINGLFRAACAELLFGASCRPVTVEQEFRHAQRWLSGDLIGGAAG
jgi:hypothetical protein